MKATVTIAVEVPDGGEWAEMLGQARPEGVSIGDLVDLLDDRNNPHLEVVDIELTD